MKLTLVFDTIFTLFLQYIFRNPYQRCMGVRNPARESRKNPPWSGNRTPLVGITYKVIPPVFQERFSVSSFLFRERPNFNIWSMVSETQFYNKNVLLSSFQAFLLAFVEDFWFPIIHNFHFYWFIRNSEEKNCSFISNW